MSKSGPVGLLIINEHASKNTRQIMGTSWKHNMFVNMGLTKFGKLSKKSVLGTTLFVVFRCGLSFVFSGNLNTYFENIFVVMRIEND